MTKIIFWIVIVTVIISEACAVPEGDSDAVCKIPGSTLQDANDICCPGYENKTGTCEPHCSSCENGHCVQPNTCACNAGYQPSTQTNVSVCEPISENTGLTCLFRIDNCPRACISKNRTIGLYWNCICDVGYERGTNNKCNPICKKPCVNGKCVAPDNCTCNDGFQRSQDDVFTCEPKCSEPCAFGNCTAPDICTCEKGYKMSNESKFNCTPVCKETCSFGNCEAPDTCVCNDGWEGNSCSKTTLLCVIAEPIPVNFTEKVSNLKGPNTTKSTTENLRIKPDAPDCRRECFDQLNTISVNFTRKISNVTYHFIRIDSSCNIIAVDSNPVSNYKNVIVAVCGILLSVMIIYAAYIMIKRIVKRRKLTNVPTSSWNNDYEVLISINERN